MFNAKNHCFGFFIGDMMYQFLSQAMLRISSIARDQKTKPINYALLIFLASMFSGLVTTAASMPVDIAKTRIQNQKYIDGKPEYKGAIDVIMKVVRNEGVTSLWKGFTPYYFRLGPHTVLTFIFLEQMNKQYKIQVLGIKDAKGGGL